MGPAKPKVGTLSQFHYGSITTQQQSLATAPLTAVSIPLWFDYNTKGDMDRGTKHRSQFHYGSITTTNIVNYSIRCLRVSIPLWFDYNDLIIEGIKVELQGLNSTMVRLQLVK